MSNLFSPLKLGALHLANRVVMAPMTRNRAGPGDAPTSLMAEYYRQRASAGLIVSEGTQPSAVGKGYWRTPGIHCDAQVAGWHEVTRAVHARAGRIVIQLMHVGRAAVSANKAPQTETVAPSAVQCRDPIPGPDGVPVLPAAPRALETREIAAVIAEYAQAARNARAAEADGVELHCTSGYLPMQFLSTNANRRTDRYGGTVLNRVRFVVETLEALAGAIGADRVGFRIFPGNRYNDIHDPDPPATYATLLQAIDSLGLAYCHLIHHPTPELNALQLVRRHWSGAIIANNGLDLQRARALLARGVDAVSFARPFIGNPDLVERFRADAALAKPDRATFYTGEERGYIDYPTLEAIRMSEPHHAAHVGAS